MAFWRRKSKDQFITLGLNEPATPARVEDRAPTTVPEAVREDLQPPAAPTQGTPTGQTAAVAPPPIEPTPTGGAPTPPPVNETQAVTERPQPAAPQPRRARTVEPVKPVAAQKPVPSRSTFSSSKI